MRKFLFRNCELTIGRWLREMAKCPYCNLEMDETSDTCEFTHIKVNGEWFYEVSKTGEPNPNRYKISEWKGPYHNGRACMETLRRINL